MDLNPLYVMRWKSTRLGKGNYLGKKLGFYLDKIQHQDLAYLRDLDGNKLLCTQLTIVLYSMSSLKCTSFLISYNFMFSQYLTKFFIKG